MRTPQGFADRLACLPGFAVAVVLAGFIPASARAQSATFNVASVRVVDPAAHLSSGHTGGPGTGDPGRVHSCCDAMITLLTRAYGVQSDRISGPAWIKDFMNSPRYELDATMPASTTKAQFQLMLQSLLMDRFHLKARHETRNFPGYDLAVAKGGPKLKASNPNMDGESPAIRSMEGGGMIRIESRAEPLSQLVVELGPMLVHALGADPADLDVPKARIADKTRLAGKYTYTLEFACDGCRRRLDGSTAIELSVAERPNIFAALQNQLGLKLEKTKDIPLDVIVIDHVDRIPTGN